MTSASSAEPSKPLKRLPHTAPLLSTSTSITAPMSNRSAQAVTTLHLLMISVDFSCVVAVSKVNSASVQLETRWHHTMWKDYQTKLLRQLVARSTPLSSPRKVKFLPSDQIAKGSWEPANRPKAVPYQLSSKSYHSAGWSRLELVRSVQV